MAISKGRNELQASIEDWGTILESLAIDINSYYQGKITNIEDDIKRFKENNYNENFEEIKSIIDTQIQEIGIYKEFQRGALEMLVVKIYSYAERHFEILLSRVSYNRSKAKNEYSKDGQPAKGVSDIEKFFYILKKHKKLSIVQISDIWIDYKAFHLLRNDITHRTAHNNSIDIDYVNSNLTQISKLLMIIEIGTR
ncbi:MAG: hypothetical protein J6L02_06900 [Bacteroidales bacterium]|nr:hypothetical protein [Bacteroidales bacterium]